VSTSPQFFIIYVSKKVRGLGSAVGEGEQLGFGVQRTSQEKDTMIHKAKKGARESAVRGAEGVQ
jgi:hypothetical protein